MDLSARKVLPEILDAIDPQDPRAMRSRRDLRRVHRALRTVSILREAATALRLARPPRTVLELGAGDGTLLLRFAGLMKDNWPRVALTVLDCQDLVSDETRAGYRAFGWELQVIRKDVMQWADEPAEEPFDLCLTNLFLHHFEAPALATLMPAIARHADALVACEPRRSQLSLLGSRVIGLLGTNYITREDAHTSVVAGFAGQELTAAWPDDAAAWTCAEYAAFPFVHCFAAVRNARRVAGVP